MTERKHCTPWKDRPAAEKITLIIGWCVIASLMVYGFLPNKPEPSASSPGAASETQPPTARYNGPSAQALSSATQYLLQLDSAMAEGMQILKAGQLRELNARSQLFKSLLEGGYAQFGRSVFQPLGKCTSAAIFANSWWQAHVTAIRQGGAETIPGSIQSHLDEYKLNRADCLQSADPSVETSAPESTKHGG
ncbi:hypothetical protein [Pseudomonas sp. NFACC05-1]|uniref:hypothetical protein n=1 Tax=Pseudomonas sp. NFACC05-1 TaxID=1566241 RepID=UPI00087140BF|nr:hypothetical protein [Pseudomonas sp. NFACC05-1]SCW97481.1 hypothetical protein SAMN03159424_05695 [Pseudomonas sp. NFACC05-1]